MAKRFFAGLGTGYIVLIANAVMMIILMPFFLSHLGEEMTGIYIMVAGLANVINYGIGWLAETSSVVLSSRSQANKKNYLLRPIYRFQQLLFGTYGLFICAILLIAGYLLPHFWNASSPENLRDVQISLYLFGINYVVYLLHNGDQSFLFSQLRINTSNGLRILYQLVFFGLTILFLQLHPHLYSVFLAQLVTTILLSFASLLILKQYQLNWWQWARPRRILWRAILMRTGGPIAGFAALWGIMMYADTVLVGFLLGPAAAAQYFAGTKIAETIALLIMRISEMAHPYFARTQKNAQHRKILYLQLNRLLLFLTLAAAIGYAYFGEMVMHVWLGDNAPELPPELFWLAGIAIIFRVAIKFEYNVVISLQAIQQLLKILFAETLIRISLLLFCVHSFGLMGVPLSLVLAYLLGLYWIVKYKTIQIVGMTVFQILSGLLVPVLIAFLCFAVWWAVQAVIWPLGYDLVDWKTAVLPALMLAVSFALLPLALWKKFPVFDYKELFGLIDRLGKANLSKQKI